MIRVIGKRMPPYQRGRSSNTGLELRALKISKLSGSQELYGAPLLASGCLCEFAKTGANPVVQALTFVGTQLDQPTMERGIYPQQKSP